MKLTVSKTKNFFNLIKDDEKENFEEVKSFLDEHNELVNAVVTKMAKGIDGFSALMLAVRFHKFKIANELIKRGADVNFVDVSPVRHKHQPVFFDLLEMFSLIINAKNTQKFKEAMEVWDLMDEYGLDYDKTATEPVYNDTPENCVEVFLRIGSRYGRNHRMHEISDSTVSFGTSFRLSDESRDVEKEKMFEEILSKLFSKINTDLVNEIDANSYRSNSLVEIPFFEKEGFIDKFTLELLNKYTKEKLGYELKNFSDTSLLKRISENITGFAKREI